MTQSLKKNWNKAIFSNIDGPGDYHTKWSKTEEDKYDPTSMGNLKYDTNEPTYETESGTQRIDRWLPRGWGGKGMDVQFGVRRWKLVHIMDKQ